MMMIVGLLQSGVFAFAQGLGGLGSIGAMAPLIFIFVIFYFLLILPQQRRQKKWQKMLGELKTGDRVITSGGIRGIVIALRDDYVHLRVAPDNLKLEVARSAIAQVAPPEGEVVSK
jgi:preprotein translocase subunit YajC